MTTNSVLITPDLHVKLIDFGLSEVAVPGETLKTICGTPLYCSPEVLFLHSTSRQRTGFHGGPADVWSVGVLIFALLTGCAPFDDSNFSRLREEVYRNTIAYPKHMSDEVKGLLKALLIFDAHLRPTVKDILAYGWLRGNVDNVPVAAETESAEPQSTAVNNNEQTSACEEQQQSPSKAQSPEWRSGSTSPTSKGARPRSLSARYLSENGTEGTSSTSGSFDDASAAAVSSAEKQQQLAAIVAASALPTHLSCLEIA